MRLKTITITATLGWLSAQAMLAGDRARLTVYMVNESIALPSVSVVARAGADKMLKVAGVSLEWRGRPPQSQVPTSIIIEMVEHTPPNLYPGALAFALPYERTHIKVFYDRVKSAVPSQTVPTLLAHVFAHEITHLLQGIVRHSDAGIMKARWDASDYLRMQSALLTFTEADIRLIKLGLTKRKSRSESQNPNVTTLPTAPALSRPLAPDNEVGEWAAASIE